MDRHIQLFWSWLIICSFVGLGITDTRTYTFGRDCFVSLEKVDEEDTIYATYDGGNLNSWCNDMSFYGQGGEILDEYKICVTPEYYEDPDCSIKLRYSKTYNGYSTQEYTCGNKPKSKYCGKQGDYFYIEASSVSTFTQSARFKLRIEAVKTSDYYARVGLIVGGVIGGLMCLSIIIGAVICVACRQKRSPGQILTPATASTVPVSQSPIGYNAQLYGNNPTNITGGNPSPMTTNSNVLGPAPYQLQPSPQNGNDTVASAPFTGYTYDKPPHIQKQ